MKPALLAVVIALSSIAFQATADISVKVHKFSDLKSWEKDDHASALEVFKETCTDLKAEDWQSICAAAFDFKNARLFFETFFLPVLISDGADSKIRGIMNLNYLDRWSALAASNIQFMPFQKRQNLANRGRHVVKLNKTVF